MVRGKSIIFLAIVLSLMWYAPVQSANVYLSVAASMTDALKEIIVLFSDKNPDTKVLPNFASSGSLAKQIAQGAPADLYVSANPKWMAYLIDNKMIDDSTDRIFAFNSLVFVGDPDSKISELAQITSLQKIAVGTPQSVPAGQYAKQAMDSAGIYERLAEDRKLVFAKDVRQALIYADRGEVGGSFVYRTDARLAQHAKVLFTVPGDLYDRVSYPLALTESGKDNGEAVAFYDFMATVQARDILTKHGFEPVE